MMVTFTWPCFRENAFLCNRILPCTIGHSLTSSISMKTKFGFFPAAWGAATVNPVKASNNSANIALRERFILADTGQCSVATKAGFNTKSVVVWTLCFQLLFFGFQLLEMKWLSSFTLQFLFSSVFWWAFDIQPMIRSDHGESTWSSCSAHGRGACWLGWSDRDFVLRRSTWRVQSSSWCANAHEYLRRTAECLSGSKCTMCNHVPACDPYPCYFLVRCCQQYSHITVDMHLWRPHFQIGPIRGTRYYDPWLNSAFCIHEKLKF